MSIWPEHPATAVPTAEQTKAALARLAEGPLGPDGWASPSIRPYTVAVNCHPLPETKHNFPQARWMHFPDIGSPTHLLVWTPSGSHCFDYHQVEYTHVGD